MEKYLCHYAEAEIAALDGLPPEPFWECVVVIPACNEGPEFLRPPPPCGGRSLMVLVINEATGAADSVSVNNQALAEFVHNHFEPLWQSAPGQGLSLWRDPSHPRDVLLADRYSEGLKFSAGGGVGLARKTGADLALSLIHRQRIRTRWIHCSDADVRLPESYFSCVDTLGARAKDAAALVYPFSHVEDGDDRDEGVVFLATRLYELSLRYYVAGMRFAGSPYAFHTIGSTMAVDAVCYAKVRGFPRREAGEDFYLLNKLAKVGSVLELGQDRDCAAIGIKSRRSDRVPFGTGAAVNRITAMEDPAAGYRYYDPAVFILLKTWLRCLPLIWRSGSTVLREEIFSGQAIDQRQAGSNQALLEALRKMKTEQALAHAFRQSVDPEQFSRQLHTWFDAFRTLKLIHALRDTCLPSISYAGLAANPAFRRLLETDVDLAEFHQRLQSTLTTGSSGGERQPRSRQHVD